MKRFLTMMGIALIALSCARQPDTLQTGDLVFMGIPQDYSISEESMDGAISAATGDGGLNLIHVAIIEMADDGPYIIDATLKYGTDRHPLDSTIRQFTLKGGEQPVYIVKRLKDNKLAKEWIEKAKSFCGQPYDMRFLPDNGAMYCSELVRESFLGTEGEYLFDEKPMNWKNEKGEIPVYWTQLFALLGMDVPQGVPGTNPQDMSKSPLLETVDVDILSYSASLAL
ncbi:MAG: hypothetical protein IJM05_06515 [Bacteroidales bacterium]|nr:hypothetical protein [Bacteroidales bacterium]